MASKPGIGEGVVSLPKGGGAHRRLGEKFQPDLFTGTGAASIPIWVPEARHGAQPALTLSYSTGSGNGPFGLGWSLDLPSVSRKTSHGTPRYTDDDVFILSGTEDLVPVSETVSGAVRRRRYRPRTEGLFARIEHVTGGDEDYWEMVTRGGVVSSFGRHEAATVRDQDRPRRTFQWLLDETRDPNGNTVTYHYAREDAAGLDSRRAETGRRYNQTYLVEIRYGNHRPAGATGDANLFSLALDYGEFPDGDSELAERPVPVSGKSRSYRPDPFSVHRLGFEVRTVRRCRRLLSRVHPDAGPPRLIRSLRLTYLDELAAGPVNRASLLASVQQTGVRAGAAPVSLPPLELTYSRFEPEARRYVRIPVDQGQFPSTSLADPSLELVDLDGYGLPGILHTTPDRYSYWSNSGGRFAVPRPLPAHPAGLSLADDGVQFADLEGRGAADLLVTKGPVTGYFRTQFDLRWDATSFRPYPVAPPFDLEDPEVRLIDVDGDGRLDVLRTADGHLEVYENRGPAGWDGPRRIVGRAAGPDVSFASPNVKLADLSGDGMQDIAVVVDGRIDYWPTTGDGTWAGRVTMQDVPRLGRDWRPDRVLLADVDGDGFADFIFVGEDQVVVALNQAGNGFASPVVVHGTPASLEGDAVRPVDLLGIGTVGLLWSREPGARGAPLAFLDLTGGTKPYLLTELDNNLGLATRISYAPSTRYWLADLGRGRTWPGQLPFPVQVVARVEVHEQVTGGRYVTEYSYHNGCYDGREREFCGFGVVEERTGERFDRAAAPVPGAAAEQFSPPTRTRTWFHQGVGPGPGSPGLATALDDQIWAGDPVRLRDDLPEVPGGELRRQQLRALRGKVQRVELYAEDGEEVGPARAERPYSVSETAYSVRREPAGPLTPEESGIFFPHQIAGRLTRWDRGEDPMVGLSFLSDFDEVGIPLRQVSVAVPRDRDWRATLPETASAPAPYLCLVAEQRFARPEGYDPDDPLAAWPYILDRGAETWRYQVANDGRQDAASLARTAARPGPHRQVIGATRTRYDGPAFEGAPLGLVGDRGLVTRAEALAFTEEILAAAYPEGRPPYLDGAAWTADYPVGFRDSLAARAGYVRDEQGWWAVRTRHRHDTQTPGSASAYGLVVESLDALGGSTTIAYQRVENGAVDDDWFLSPKRVTDPAGLVVDVWPDLESQRVRRSMDANGNETEYAFDALGLVERMARKGKQRSDQSWDGDSLDHPTAHWSYDLDAFRREGQPASTHTWQRWHHAGEVADRAAAGRPLPPQDADRFAESREFYDGAGRLLQKRSLAEPEQADPSLLLDQQGAPAGFGPEARFKATTTATPVVVSGWAVHNNKGWVVEEAEPFLGDGWAFTVPTDEESGGRVRHRYDPCGHLVGTVHPDGSQTHIVYGVPDRLDTPDQFSPTPWLVTRYDQNDNSGRTNPGETAALKTAAHLDTPMTLEMDALGRVVAMTSRNGQGPGDSRRCEYRHDLRDNPTQVVDALGRPAVVRVFDLLDRPLRIESIDAGTRTFVLDAAGNLVERRDSKGALALRQHDALGRVTRVWARDLPTEPVTLRERTEHGDELTATPAELEAARLHNLLGRPAWHHDEAGLVHFDRYDFKGNLLVKRRQVISDAVLAEAASAAKDPPVLRADWETMTDADLDPAQLVIERRYDALDRTVAVVCPEDATGHRAELTVDYNPAGLLTRVAVDGVPFVRRIGYNARGERVLVEYGNDVMARHAYHSASFRLARLRAERTTHPDGDPDRLASRGAPLMDLTLAYDLVGNLIREVEKVPGGGVPGSPDGSDLMRREFTYDPLYRLVEADGRESDLSPTEPPLWDDGPVTQDPTQVRAYRETYAYDAADNLVEVKHAATRRDGSTAGWTRKFDLDLTVSNRLVQVGSTACAYDDNGNLRRTATNRHFHWDWQDRMRGLEDRPEGSAATVQAQYLYDTHGMRVKRWVRRGSVVETTVYVDGVFEAFRRAGGGSPGATTTLQVMDGERPVATMRTGNDPEDASPAVQFHLDDPRHSSVVVVDAAGEAVNREEYRPFGQTSFGSFARKRYRYTGKERDQESGCYYHRARYYSPGLSRWLSVDPLGEIDSLNPYAYVSNLPTVRTDPTGAAGQPSNEAVKVAEDQVTKLAEQKYGHLGVRDISDHNKPTYGTGPDRLFILGAGDNAVLIEIDAKLSQQDKPVGIGDVSSFKTQAKTGGKARVELLEAAAKGGPVPISKAEFAALREAAEAGLVLEEVAGFGSVTGLSTKTRANQVSYMQGDMFAHAREQVEVREAKKLSQFIDRTIAPPPPDKRTAIQIANEISVNIEKNASKQVLSTTTDVAKVGAEAAETGAKSLGKKALKMVPFLGWGVGVASMTHEWKQGNYVSAVADAVGLVPAVGDTLDLLRFAFEPSSAY